MEPTLEQYRGALARYLDVSGHAVALFQKGRVGLYAILQSLGIGEGDEVIIPAFTCVVVPNAILYLGARPVYVDIDPQTFNMDPDKIEAALTSRTRLVIAQNTFGLAPDLDRIYQVLKDRPIRLIEDCTHGFGGTYKGKKNGTIAEASFFSTQWNKPFSTGIGGFTVARSEHLARDLRRLESQYANPRWVTRKALQAQLIARRHFMPPFLYWPLLKLYRYLSNQGIITGSSSGMELQSPQMPSDYLRSLSQEQAQAGIKALASFQDQLRHQHKIAKIYEERLVQWGVPPLKVPEFARHTYLKYPFLVKDRQLFMERAVKYRIPLGDWMLSPIHPVQEGFERWVYPYGANPNGEYISRHILNLPTDPGISEEEALRILRFLEKNKSELILKPKVS